ncbi:MAG: glycosyltransferase family 2 protein [Gammaproteobacteria bacterium]|nr:MAG: glycosyltransferase family 2 protein [Gammaproteobacteria bacterium]
MPSITAIITTHNRARLLPRAIESVMSQTRPADEIIVVDDGSTDDTQALIRSNYPDIHYLRQPQSGISTARNLAIRAAQSEWLAFLDDDDSWLPRKLDLQLEKLHQHPDHRVCHTEEIWVRNGVRVNAMDKHTKSGGWIYPQCLPLCVISPSSVMIHRLLFDDVGLFDETLPACEDYDLWLRICAREPVLFIETPMITKYGGHEDQLSRRYWGMDRFRIQSLEKILASDILDQNDTQLTVDMLARKLRIYLKGVEKRGRSAEAESLRSRLHELETLREPSLCC